MSITDESGDHAPVICRECGYKLSPQDTLCPWCEQSTASARLKYCLKCQAAMTHEDVFCGRCGASGSSDSSAAPSSDPPPVPGLHSCPSCGKQVSTLATACPQCGHPFRSVLSEVVSQPMGTYTVRPFALGLAVVGVLLLIMATHAWINAGPTAAARDLMQYDDVWSVRMFLEEREDKKRAAVMGVLGVASLVPFIYCYKADIMKRLGQHDTIQ